MIGTPPDSDVCRYGIIEAIKEGAGTGKSVDEGFRVYERQESILLGDKRCGACGE